MRRWHVLTMIYRQVSDSGLDWSPDRLVGPFESKANAEAFALGVSSLQFFGNQPRDGSVTGVVMEADAP